MRRSLLHHCQLADGLREDYPAPEIARRMFYRADAKVGVRWEIPDDLLQRSHFDRIVNEKIVWNSSPGFPHMLKYADNRSFFGLDASGNPNPLRVEEIWGLVQLHLADRFSDPIYLFVKPEPHKLSKMGRKRLISSVSVIDQIIDHMLDDAYNEEVVAQSLFGAIKVGWTHLNGGWKVFPPGGLSIDKTGWDWTMRYWLLCMCFEMRRLACKTQGKLYEKWLDVATWRFQELFKRPRFALPDGTEIRQRFPGVMKSGSVRTIVDNSLGQILLHERVVAEEDLETDDGDWLWAMGDDTYQSRPIDIKRYLERLSQYCIIKEYNLNQEFAGNRFQAGGRIEPMYKGKHAYNLLYADPKIQADLATAYSLLYHRSRERDAVRNIVSNYAEPPLLCELDEIYDGE